MKKFIKIIEVGPRDGFQSVKEFIPTELKKEIIDDLVDANLQKIQITSFVSPKAIPQLQDSKEITKYVLNKYKDRDIEFFALVPNLRGTKDAYESGLKEISYVISVSESHNKANVNKTTEESFKELESIVKSYPDLKVNLDLATAFGCPFEGNIDENRVIKFIRKGMKLGIRNFNLCDTIGVSSPNQIDSIAKRLLDFDDLDLHFEVHIHDTRNMGILNTVEAIKNGILSVQSSIGGLGGCPFAPGASGNTATEDLVYVLDDMGYETGIDFEKLLQCAKKVKEKIKGNFSGHQINIKSEKCIL
ncbi:hydroxymethylglutaryl-CoA lyase [Eubacterium multiforme]|uniref:Hydroxymethylglutaryl-CoA lyase n=1 Tax=Eubacterium multiforme TaxID=83339 RepID=A0ABT9UQV4_9FIRM|nr:hydroxymethylglutaryl-CoA lyase [Eubacterium multiforme]MDQ0149022.1 hydroxymethylglutaryl-CoA lyase [Eubacterium multiforme]